MPSSLIIPVVLATSPAPPAAADITLGPRLAAAAEVMAPALVAPAEQVETPVEAAPADPPKAEAPAPEPVATARHGHARGDSLEGFNRAMFSVWETLDKAAYRPAALAYKHVTPKPLRTGIRHVLSNIGEPLVFLNFILQGKPGRASKTLARFVINSTIGIGGVIDVAKDKSINLPHRDNSFGSTLALYGVGPGPYIFLPFLGPSTLRDLFGSAAQGLVLPMAVGKPFNKIEYQVATGVVGGLDQRAEADDQLKALLSGAVDPYATLRSAWFQNRVAQIDALRSHQSEATGADQPELDDPLADPQQPGDAKPAAPSQAPELSDPLTDPAATPDTP